MVELSDNSDKLGGRFIVIDGPDGSGKSTQLALLAEYLRSRAVKVCVTRDPGGTVIGDKVRQILLDGAHGEICVECELMLYMASRAQLATELIRPALARGECVLCDRYVSATIAYQGAAGADVAAIRSAADVAVGDLRADLTVILDLPAEEGLARLKGAPDRMESKDAAFHRKVRELFLEQARQNPARFAVIDARGAVEQVQQRLRDTISKWEFDPSDA